MLPSHRLACVDRLACGDHLPGYDDHLPGCDDLPGDHFPDYDVLPVSHPYRRLRCASSLGSLILGHGLNRGCRLLWVTWSCACYQLLWVRLSDLPRERGMPRHFYHPSGNAVWSFDVGACHEVRQAQPGLMRWASSVTRPRRLWSASYRSHHLTLYLIPSLNVSNPAFPLDAFLSRVSMESLNLLHCRMYCRERAAAARQSSAMVFAKP